MSYELIFAPRSEKELERVPKKYYNRITSAIARISLDPYSGKKLKGDFDGYYSIRVWPYRILYQVYKSKLIIVVLSIGHRQGVYKK